MLILNCSLFFMHTIRSTSHHSLQISFWQELQKVLSDCSDQESIVIGLSGGSSLDIFYEVLALNFVLLEWAIREKIRFVFLDERMVPRGHTDSNEWQLRVKFLTRLLESGGIQESQILSVDTSLTDPWLRYSTRVPHIDIGVFWVGSDGHIASLFPSHPLLLSESDSYLEILDSPKPPAHRITVSPMMIRDIGYVFVSFMQGKEQALENFLDKKISLEKCPAKLLRQSGELVVLSDIER